MADIEREQWLAARSTARRHVPAPAIESCTVLPRAEGGFEVVVHGHGLRSGAVPPRVVVGGRTVRSVRGGGGTVLRGLVDAAGVGDEVVVDLGPGGRAVGRVGTAGAPA
jgi:hypothetical protein